MKYISVIFILASCVVESAVGSVEDVALCNIAQATNLPKIYHQSGWRCVSGVPEPSICSWKGVTCSSSRVVRLNLEKIGVTGSLPDSIGDLVELTELNIFENNFSGSIPNTISKLSKLVNFEVSKNSLAGSIPDGISLLKALSALKLSSNRFNGTIPEGIKYLTELLHLDLSNNKITGSLPQESNQNPTTIIIEDTSTQTCPCKMEVLKLSGNEMSFRLSSSFASMQNLRSLYVDNNKITSSIPESFSKLTNLEYLVLNSNIMDGDLEEDLSALSILKIGRAHV